MATKKKALTELEITERLGVKYPSPQWALLPQYRNGTGFNQSRTLDAIAIGCWPSRGMEILGFEVKSSRQDLLRELKNPRKIEEVADLLDRIYIVIGDREICKDPNELPRAWGLIVPHGTGLRVLKEAEPQERIDQIPRTLLASIMRGASGLPGYSFDARLDQVKAEARAAGEKRGREWGERSAKDATARLASLTESIQLFEAAAGIQISDYLSGYGKTPAAAGEVFAQIMSGRLVGHIETLRRFRDNVGRILDTVDVDIEKLTASDGEVGP